MTRILRLTLLAPDIVETILEGREPLKLTLADLVKAMPEDWNKQRARFK